MCPGTRSSRFWAQRRWKDHNDQAAPGPDAPDQWQGPVFGLDITRDSIEIRRRAGYLAQDPRYYEHMTARETLLFKARFFYCGPKPEIEKRVQDRLEIVGLLDKADRPIRGRWQAAPCR